MGLAGAERGYIPAQQPSWIRQKMESAHSEREVQECVEAFQKFLTANDTARLGFAGASTAPSLAVDATAEAAIPKRALPDVINLLSDDSDG
mmetsp:Transcript_26895/g.54040  ORF Transcript_26895/g.54040 Transcript_26895/m.54040 type:complete len:91 (-) Transcript_26895:132-404(-)